MHQAKFTTARRTGDLPYKLNNKIIAALGELLAIFQRTAKLEARNRQSFHLLRYRRRWWSIAPPNARK